MQINRALLESSAIAKHFMTDRERRLRYALCKLLVSKGHKKYAERFSKLDFNIVDSTKHPDFTAAISFDEATVFISDGFLGSGQGVFNQLDVLLRHELAHNLMMHQIRLMNMFKNLHSNDPDEAYDHIKCSSSLHEILNFIEDFEISNKRYTTRDKDIVRKMELNGNVIGGLVTEDHRGSWANMSLEAMYDELSKELIQINSNIRSNPYWEPTKDGTYNQTDILKLKGSELIAAYSDFMRPSSIKAPIDVFIKSSTFNGFAPVFKNIVIKLHDSFKDFTSDLEKQDLLNIAEEISLTDPQEVFDITNPKSGDVVCTLYTPEDKMLASDVLKNLGGNINYNPQKFIVKRKINTQEYKDAWNKVIKTLDNNQFDDDTLNQLLDAIDNN